MGQALRGELGPHFLTRLAALATLPMKGRASIRGRESLRLHGGDQAAAARHLGLLAFAPRLLAARDVASGDVCFLPVSVGTSAMAAPTLLPPTATHAITRSRRYWPAGTSIGEPDTGVHWLHVQRRTGFLSYADDPHGHRSIFARTARSATPQLDGDVDGERDSARGRGREAA